MLIVILGLIGTFGNFINSTTTSTGGAIYHTATEQKPKEPTTGDLQVTRSSDNKDISYNGFDGKNALDLLKLVGYIETKDYGAQGQFVQGIDGVKGDTKHFWAFYVNGKFSDVGASNYQTKTGDRVEWKYELIK